MTPLGSALLRRWLLSLLSALLSGWPAWKISSGLRSSVLFIKHAGQPLGFPRSVAAYLSVLLASGP